MYKKFFGLKENPFNVNPDPRYLYLTPNTQEALACLTYGIETRKGFIMLTGEVGTGKTTILNALLHKLGPLVQTAYIFNTSLTVEDLFAALFEELELDWQDPFRKTAALSRLNKYLIERMTNGLQTLLIVDEAQNLSDAMLEEIRMLSNLETPQSKLLQIMLVGQPELADKLSQPGLRQLRQRVELRHAIRPLRADETAAYVRERLLVAGHPKGDLFAGSAERAVHRFARGIPRVVNVLCDNALIAAFAREQTKVSAQLVELSAAELGLSANPGDPHFVRERGNPESKARAGWLRRLWRRGGAGPQPEL